MSNLKRSDYTRPYGHRFSPEINARLNEYVKRRRVLHPELSSPDSEKKMQNYRINVNPSSSYNYNRPDRSKRSRTLTVEFLPAYLFAADLSVKEFLEVCMEENKDLWDSADEQWTHLEWPTPLMADMCGMLEAMPEKKKKAVQQFISDILPASYDDFRMELETPSEEYGPNNEFLPAHKAEQGYDRIEIKSENMSNRLYETIKYQTAGMEIGPVKTCHLAGIEINIQPLTRPRHYWGLFSFSQFYRICKLFRISPHWLLYGQQDSVVLAEDELTETIMDMFSFLPEQMQTLAIAYAASLQKRGI